MTETLELRVDGLDVGNAVKGLDLLASQTVQLILGWPLPVAVGDILVLRHTKGPPVIELQKCKDTTIEEVSIYAAPAMAIVMGGRNGAKIWRLQVEYKPKSNRLLSTNADALHCASCSGTITVAECTFAGMGDDAINVTGLYLAVEAGQARGTLILTGGRHGSI